MCFFFLWGGCIFLFFVCSEFRVFRNRFFLFSTFCKFLVDVFYVLIAVVLFLGLFSGALPGFALLFWRFVGLFRSAELVFSFRGIRRELLLGVFVVAYPQKPVSP